MERAGFFIVFDVALRLYMVPVLDRPLQPKFRVARMLSRLASLLSRTSITRGDSLLQHKTTLK